MKKTWEYTKTDSLSIEEMNKLGNEGWENYSNVFDGCATVLEMLWKRPIE